MTDHEFEGLASRECGEHRTTGQRAWCHDCTEWCYPQAPCRGCELPQLRATADPRHPPEDPVTTVNIRSTTPDEPGLYRLEVDGHDVSNLVTTARVDLTAREPAEVTLGLIQRRVAITLTEAHAGVDGETRVLLEALGWTPPGAQS